MGIKEIAVGRFDIFKIDPKILQEEEGFNLRTEGDDLNQYIAELSEYMKNKGCPGVLTIHMKDSQPFVIDGHCRRRAALLAIEDGALLSSLPCRMVDKYDNDADKIAYLISTNSGRPLSPIEKASVCKRLHDLGLENKDIAVKTGLSLSRVVQLLELLSAPQQVLDMVEKGEVSASLAAAEVKADPENVVDTLKTALKSAKEEGKKKITKKDIAPVVVKSEEAEIDDMMSDWVEPVQKKKREMSGIETDPCVIAFESFDTGNWVIKNWVSFKAGWDAAMRCAFP